MMGVMYTMRNEEMIAAAAIIMVDLMMLSASSTSSSHPTTCLFKSMVGGMFVFETPFVTIIM